MTQPTFSLARLETENPGLARHYLWDTNPMPAERPLWLHLGCGVRVFDGFANLDICQQDPRVIQWNFLDLWPAELEGDAEGAFSECCFEHFFHGEQTYILCNLNRALQPAGVARLLMPKLTFPPANDMPYHPPHGEFLSSTFGVETMADAWNYGARFTGHRWLHDQLSLSRMAEICGFEAIPTDHATTSVAKLSGLNLRDESSTSFANDLCKKRGISRILVSPSRVTGATRIEALAGEAALFVATENRPVVEYRLPESLISASVACINFRSSYLSVFDWALKTLVIDGINSAAPWYFDETLKSRPCMNIITRSQLRVAFGDDRMFSTLFFSPAFSPGEHFTIGCAELFVLE